MAVPRLNAPFPQSDRWIAAPAVLRMGNWGIVKRRHQSPSQSPLNKALRLVRALPLGFRAGGVLQRATEALYHLLMAIPYASANRNIARPSYPAA